MLKAPDGAFITSGGYASIVPKAYIAKVGDDGFAKTPDRHRPVEVRQPRDRPVRRPHPLRRVLGHQARATSSLEFRIIPDDNSRVSALRSGEIDAAAQIPPQSVDTLKSDSQPEVVTSSSPATTSS